MQHNRLLIAQRHIAIAICVAALLLKLLVPTGYMIDASGGHLSIIACPGMAPAPVAPVLHMTMPMAGTGAMHAAMPDHAQPGDHGTSGDHGKSGGHGKVELPCAFAGFSAATLGAIDPILLAAFVAFVMLLGHRPLPGIRTVRRSHLRPPLRAPPAYF